MGYAIIKIGDHYNDQTRAEIIMAATDDETSLPTDVAVGSVAYREDMSAQYLFGVSGSWKNVTSALAGPVQYSVTYDANGGTGGPTDSDKYYSGEMVTVLFTSDPTQESFTFVGWALTDDATEALYASGATTEFNMGASNVTLYAVWQAA